MNACAHVIMVLSLCMREAELCMQLQVHINQRCEISQTTGRKEAGGQTALMWAIAKCGDASLVARLLVLGAAMLPVDDQGRNAYDYANNAAKDGDRGCAMVLMLHALKHSPGIIKRLNLNDTDVYTWLSQCCRVSSIFESGPCVCGQQSWWP